MISNTAILDFAVTYSVYCIIYFKTYRGVLPYYIGTTDVYQRGCR